MYRWTLAVITIALILTTAAPVIAESAPPQQLQAHTLAAPEAIITFEDQIEAWIRTLSDQQGFEAWKDARWTRHPLGPGTHGWLILLHKNGREIGYMVVGSTTDGKWSLTEYGVGENPLFSMKTLYRSLVQHELIDPSIDFFAYLQAAPLPPERVYYSPLHAVWKIAHGSEWIYLDAKTGEWLPLSDPSFSSLQSPDHAELGLPIAGLSVKKALLLPTFDPFDDTDWITDKPIRFESAQHFAAALTADASPITYTANLYGKTVLAPFAATGFHDWGAGVPYIVLEQEGARYIPYSLLTTFGDFYQERLSPAT